MAQKIVLFKVFILGTAMPYYLFKTYPSKFNLGTLSVVGPIKPGLPVPEVPAFAIYDNVTIEQPCNATSSTITTCNANGTMFVSHIVQIESASDIMLDLIVALIIMPIMGMLECFAIVKSLGRKNGYRIDATQEMLALGIGNIVQSFFQAFPCTVAVTRCALNDQCKVKTQLGSIISAVIVMIALGCLTQIFYYVSKASLAAIIIMAGYNLIDFAIVKHMAKEYWRDVIVFFLAFLLCLLWDMAYGILLCLLVNMVTFLRPVVRMSMAISQEEVANGKFVKIVRLSHGMKYPSADKFIDRLARVLAEAEDASDVFIVLDCQFFTGIDYTGLQALRTFLLMAVRKKKRVVFTNLSKRLHTKLSRLGLEHFIHVDNAEEAIKGQLFNVIRHF